MARSKVPFSFLEMAANGHSDTLTWEIMGICEICEMGGLEMRPLRLLFGASLKEGHKPRSAALPCSSRAF